MRRCNSDNNYHKQRFSRENKTMDKQTAKQVETLIQALNHYKLLTEKATILKATILNMKRQLLQKVENENPNYKDKLKQTLDKIKFPQ